MLGVNILWIFISVFIFFNSSDECYGVPLVVGTLILTLERFVLLVLLNVVDFVIIYRGYSDPDKTAFCWIHMGGSCTAPSFAHVVRRSLIFAGYPQVKVYELNYSFFFFFFFLPNSKFKTIL
jgi:predicted nucleotide-binding protein (sugar kinase/HSP70/actin superfamily)